MISNLKSEGLEESIYQIQMVTHAGLFPERGTFNSMAFPTYFRASMAKKILRQRNIVLDDISQADVYLNGNSEKGEVEYQKHL